MQPSGASLALLLPETTSQTTIASAPGDAAAGHDAAAEAAAGGVSEVDDAGERVGGVNRAGFRLPASGFRTSAGAIQIIDD